MNGSNTALPAGNSNHSANRLAKPPPSGPAPPAPVSTPPVPPNNSQPHQHPHPPHPHAHHHPHSHPPNRVNGVQKGKKKNDIPVDPVTMYESVKNRIAALEEEEGIEEEEERRFGE